LEGLCVARVLGTRTSAAGRRPVATWSYVTLAGLEYEDGQAPSPAELMRGLSGCQLMFTDDDDTLDFAARYDGRFETMRRTGAWEQAHPWIETLLPEQAMVKLLPEMLEATPIFLGDGHRLALVAASGPPLFMRPRPDPTMVFSVLPMGVPDALRDDALRALRRVHDLGVGAGGKRYLSGWLGMMDESAWRAHYGDQFDAWVAAKQRFDPTGTLVSTLFPA
jgi:cytokinin dehydrogenase